MRQIKAIVIHCTDSDDSLDIGFREVDEWHRQRGWLSDSGISCGYHYIIRRDGTIEMGRPVEEKGAHVYGHNSFTIGISWVGRKQMSANQLDSLKDLVQNLQTTYNIDIDDVLGHKELDSKKTCPNLDMNWLRAELVFQRGDL